MSRFMEKAVGVLVGSKKSKQCVPGSRRAKSTSHSWNRSMVDGDYFPLFSTFKPMSGQHFEHGYPHTQERHQHRITKITETRGLRDRRKNICSA